MRLIHNIRSSNQTKVLLKILKSGYLIKSTELNEYKNKLNAIYFNLYDKKLYKESKKQNINIILKPTFLINKDFYFCIGNNYESCIDDEYKFNLKNKKDLFDFKRKIKQEIKIYTTDFYNFLFNNISDSDDDYIIIKNIKQIKKHKDYNIEKHIYAYSYSHEILLTENININNIEEIIIQYYDIDETIEEISNYLKINYPKIKLTIIT